MHGGEPRSAVISPKVSVDGGSISTAGARPAFDDRKAPACQIRFAASRKSAGTAYIRQRQLELGDPLSFDENYPGITALEAFGSAVAADIVNGLHLRAGKQRLDIQQIETVVKVWLQNPLAFIDVVGEEGDPRIESVRLDLYVNTLEPEASVRKLLDETLKHSPLHLTLQNAIAFDVNLQIVI